MAPTNFSDPNAAALAAGAKPGQTVTVGGSTFTVMPPGGSGGPSTRGVAPKKNSGYEDKADANNKNPKIKYEGNYPNFYVEQGIDGYQIIRSLEPGKESFFEIFPSGNYRSHGPNGEEVRVTTDSKHDYVANNHSQNIDGHKDDYVGGTSRTNVAGDEHRETDGNKTTAGSGVHIKGTNDSVMESQTEGDKWSTTEGNIITDHTGHVNHNITGDSVQQVFGNHYQMVTGEHGINNQGGNFDMQTDSGTTRIFSGKDILVESGTKITLKVGSSTITMVEGNITIKAKRIDLNP